MEQKRNHDALLVTLADKNYIDQAKQLFSSVYWNAGWKGDYMLLSHEIPEKDLKWFRDKGILVKKCKPLYQKGVNNYSLILSDKFYLFTPEFKKWKNIVYLDADIIVRGSLERLAKVKGFWAVPDIVEPRVKRQFLKKGKMTLNHQLPLRHNSIAFNAGVFAFSTDRIKKKTFQELEYISKKYLEISKYEDQLIFNLTFYKDWKKLDLRYNVPLVFLKRFYKINPENKDGIVMHFSRAGRSFKRDLESDYRPWDPENRFYPEWRNNLKKAESINLSKIQKVKILGEGHFFKSLSFIFHFKRFFCLYRVRRFLTYTAFPRLKDLFVHKTLVCQIKLRNFLPSLFGLIGKFIKKLNPRIYHKLKRIKDGTKKKS